jgi:benzoylformate decarboxylase
MASRAAKVALFEQLEADGVEYMFGNPGTVEQGFLDVATDSPIEYILALHEAAAVGMADGYARATGRPGVVQLHSGVGLGNGIGMLYQANRGHSPLVVLVGEAGIRYEATDAQMAVDLVAMARPVTKYATRVTHPTSLLRLLRRAIKMALTPPMGPVLVVLPADVMDELVSDPVVPTRVPSTRVAPEASVVAAATRALTSGRNPLILYGDGVAASGAQPELARVADLLGAPMWGVNSSEVNVDTTHPRHGGGLGHMFGTDSARIVEEADAVLIVGTYVFPEVFPTLRNPFHPEARIVHVDLDAYEIAKNHPVELGIVADPKLTLAAIADEIGRHRPAAGPAPAVPRSGAGTGDEPTDLMHTFVRRLAERGGTDLVVFDEALTASAPIARYLPPRRPGTFFQTRGGSLGVGIPGAIGVTLAQPGRRVVGFTGDGGSMYTIQALWTAARHHIAAGFVICNNHRYRLLDLNIEQYWRDQGIAPRPHPAAFDLSTPDIGFTGLAAALGVPARRVEHAGAVDDAIDALLAADGPFLVDLVID